MFNGKYKKLDTILPQIRKYPFTENLSKREVAHQLVGLLQLIGATMPLERLYANIELSAHKAAIPQGMMYLHGVNYKGLKCTNQGLVMRYASDIYHSALHSPEAKAQACGTSTAVPASGTPVSSGDLKVAATAITDADVVSIVDPKYVNYDLSYTINGMAIDSSLPSGWIEVAYDGVKLDDQGYPMIPDDKSFELALRYFVIKEYAEPSYIRGDVTDRVYSHIETQYNWYVGQAFSSLTMLSADQADTMANGLMRIIPQTDLTLDGYKQMNKPRH